MGTQRDRINLFFPLVAEPGLDHIFGEHITTQQERMIGFERVKRLLQRARRRLHRQYRYLIREYAVGIPEYLRYSCESTRTRPRPAFHRR